MFQHKFSDQTHFYRYFDFNGAFRTIGGRSIRLQSPRLFNDPFDSQFLLRPPLTVDEVLAFIIETTLAAVSRGTLPQPLPTGWTSKEVVARVAEICAQNSQEQIRALLTGNRANFEKHFEAKIQSSNAEIQSYMQDQFVYCLTTNLKSVVMWSHYAEQHKGVVLRFDCCAKRDNIFRAATPVKYVSETPTLGTRQQWFEYMKTGNSNLDAPSIYTDLVSAKSSEWEYECEHRIVVPVPAAKGRAHCTFGLHPDDVSEVYLGCQMGDDEKRDLIQLARARHPTAKIFLAIKSSRKFELDFVQLPKQEIH